MDEAAVAMLRRDFSVIYDEALVDSPQRLTELLADCRALIVRNRTRVGENLLAGAGGVKVVGRLGVGLDNIDLDYCRLKGIKVFPATGANNIAVAEYVMAGLLLLFRGCFWDSASVAAGNWPRQRQIGGELYGKSLGLVGFGGIARAVAERARVFGLRILAHDPLIPAQDPCWQICGVERLELDDLLARSEAVSLHLPFTKDTRSLFDAERIARLRPGAFFINSARGGIVDEAALAAALREKRLGGALIDVYAQEPLKAGTALADAPNCILTAHIAGVTRESNVRVSALIAEKVRAALL
jgi:(S)-sulfolactate dehydrogenase